MTRVVRAATRPAAPDKPGRASIRTGEGRRRNRNPPLIRGQDSVPAAAGPPPQDEPLDDFDGTSAAVPARSSPSAN